MEGRKFNISVYGILIDDKKRVLVTDELVKGNRITKFPGGGLEFGEGTLECIKREFLEETNNKVEVVEHFYTTDYYQPSAYNRSHQIISIYYIVKPANSFSVESKETAFDFGNVTRYIQTFRWLDLNTISENDFTLPIDKIVGKLLREKYGKAP